MTEETDDEQEPVGERSAAHKRYNMKALGRLVDSNRLTGVSRPTDGARSRPASSARDLAQHVDADGTPSAGVSFADSDGPGGDDAFGSDRLESVDSGIDQTDRLLAIANRMNIPIRLAGNGGASTPTDLVARDRTDDGVGRATQNRGDRRTGLAARVDGALRVSDLEMEPSTSLARQMLDGEIGPGGRISDPRDVPGIVLDLAKDVPASVAVSVVRIDEEIEVVGDSIDPTIDPALFTAAFSGVFRSVRPAAQALQEGPLGKIRDVVVEGERMDLILRPLGDRYFLMVLEDRKDPQANLAATRMRMASIAPGVTAILAQQDGEV
ncbi:MAG TPA: hypothetical protein VFN21_12610 [Acidimicrobiales bacterium]|nr:hypothetical protein [Acidimicrobiales bacterium]